MGFKKNKGPAGIKKEKNLKAQITCFSTQKYVKKSQSVKNVY